jgi:hypothetical protein
LDALRRDGGRGDLGAEHPKAMRVMFDPAGRWLDNEHEDARGLAAPYSDERMAIVG